MVLGKFPLPPQGLIEYFGLSPMLASTVALSELLTGLVLIISGFIKNPFGNILTRLSGLNDNYLDDYYTCLCSQRLVLHNKTIY